MSRESDFRSTPASLWFRLMSLGIVGLVFAEALILAKARVQGWTFNFTLAGMVLGSICTAILVPFLWHFSASRERLMEWATRVAVVLVLLPDSRFA